MWLWADECRVPMEARGLRAPETAAIDGRDHKLGDIEFNGTHNI